MYHGQIVLTDLQADYLRRAYPVTKNKDLAYELGISESSVHRWARKLGLRKTPDHINRCREHSQKCAYEANRANGFEAQRSHMNTVKHLGESYRYGRVVYRRKVFTPEMQSYIDSHYATESATDIAGHLGIKYWDVYNYARVHGLYKDSLALKDIRQKGAEKARKARRSYLSGETRPTAKVRNSPKMPPRAISWSARLQSEYGYRLLGRFVFGIDNGTRRSDKEDDLEREYGFVFKDLT